MTGAGSIEDRLHDWIARHNEPTTDDMEYEKIDSYLSGVIAGIFLAWAVAMVWLVVW